MKKVSKILGLLLVSGVLGLSACQGVSMSGSSNQQYSENNPSNNNNNGNSSSQRTNTSSQEDTRSKDAFKKLKSLADFNVNIQNATSLGLSKNAVKTANAKRANDDADPEEFETSYTMVKTTTDYSADDPTVDENGEVGVSFTKVDTTVTTTVTDGQKTLIAGLKEGDNDEVIVEEYGEDTITFKSDTNHEYRVVDSEGKEIVPWFEGKEGKTETPDLPVNHSKGWDEFTVYQRLTQHILDHDSVDYYYETCNLVGDTVSFYAQQDYTYDDPNWGKKDYSYEYRLLDGDDVVVGWTTFENTSGIFADLDPVPSNPRVQRKTTTHYYPFVRQPDSENKVDFKPAGDNTVSVWGIGKEAYTNNEGYYYQHEYCVKDSEENVVVNWTAYDHTEWKDFTIGGVPYVKPITTKYFAIEARSIDAVVSYPAYEGFTYTLLDKDNNVLVDAVTADNAVNVSEDESLIVFDGLREGERYTLKYHGVGQETTVEQSKVGGEIDKMSVYSDQFTFVSFVPYGTSQRPADDDLKYEADGIANYDKRDYYTNETRQSFIFDNYSGFIYLIKDFNIKYIHNNLLLSAGDNKVYDFKINEDNDLEIFALFNSNDLNYLNFFKDKYGNNVIQNDKLDKYDANTNTYYFVAQANQDQITRIMTAGEYSSTQEIYNEINRCYNGVYSEAKQSKANRLNDLINDINRRNNTTNQNDSGYRYYLTTNNETLYVETYSGNDTIIKEAYLIVDNSTHRELTVRDSFSNRTSCGWNDEIIRASKGYIYSISAYYQTAYNYSTNTHYEKATYGTLNQMFFKDIASGEIYCTTWESTNNNYFNLSYFAQYGTILIFSKKLGTLYKWTFDDLSKYTRLNMYYGYSDGEGGTITVQGINIMSDVEVVRNDVSLDESYSNFVTYDVNGTTSYEIVVEEVDGELKVTPYVSGEYEAPITKIVLQPINR